MQPLRRADVVLAACTTAWIVWGLTRMSPWTVDDAYIVARYADNLVRHGRLVFDASIGDRVEGFTSPLAMMIAIAARALGGDPIAATKTVGAACAVAWPALVVALARALRCPAGTGGVAAVLTGVLPEHVVHARSGLETEIFAAISLACLIAFVRVLRGGGEKTFAAFALVTALTRPEGFAIAIVLAGLALLVRRRSTERRRRLARALVLVLVAPLAVLVVARLSYYHALLPNTFDAKRAAVNASQLRSLESVLDISFFDVAVAAGALAFVVFASGARAARARPSERIVLGASALLLAVEIAVYARSEPVMDYANRFAWHGMAFVAVFVVAAVARALHAARAMREVAVRTLAAALLALAIADAALRASAAREAEWSWALAYERSIAELYAPAIRWIEESTSPRDVVAVYPDAGRIPFETGRPSIDFGRLNDRALARAHTDAAVVDRFFADRPDVLVVSQPSAASGHLYDSGADAIVADPRFSSAYALVRTFRGTGDGRLLVYARRGAR